MWTSDEILKRAMTGDVRALARAITLIECRHEAFGKRLSKEKRRDGVEAKGSYVLGITGAPGAGKSTWVELLIRSVRARGESIAVVAVDPSSPFSGGAILGDRIRMEAHTMDSGVYLRSLSSRGHLGGLSAATSEVVALLETVGFDWVIVETVGVGQSELGVMEVADTVVVIVTPEAGDTVQAMKAGLFEVADVFLVNKMDRPGADRMVKDLQESIDLGGPSGWRVPVLKGSGLKEQGQQDVLETVLAHHTWCLGPGRDQWETRRADARERFLLDLVAERAREQVKSALSSEKMDQIRRGDADPYAVLDEL